MSEETKYTAWAGAIVIKNCPSHFVEQKSVIVSPFVVTKDGKKFERIPKGHDDFSDPCHDCGIPADMNLYHWDGCDEERCPACGGQFMGCDCEEFDHFESDGRNVIIQSVRK